MQLSQQEDNKPVDVGDTNSNSRALSSTQLEVALLIHLCSPETEIVTKVEHCFGLLCDEIDIVGASEAENSIVTNYNIYRKLASTSVLFTGTAELSALIYLLLFFFLSLPRVEHRDLRESCAATCHSGGVASHTTDDGVCLLWHVLLLLMYARKKLHRLGPGPSAVDWCHAGDSKGIRGGTQEESTQGQQVRCSSHARGTSRGTYLVYFLAECWR
jgi:hypothetical protein